MTAGIVLCGSLSQQAVTLGAAMHNAAYAACGLRWTYVPFEIDTSDGALHAALAGMRALKIRGLGISVPFKQAIIPLLDDVDEHARRIGAVNTVVNEGGRLVGHNTDWVGALRAIEEQRRVADLRVLLLGAGGAARAIAQGLHDAGANITICNRSRERAQQLADPLTASVLPWDARHELHAFNIVINATIVGMHPHDDRSPIDKPAFQADQLVMDIVYKPLRTRLLRAAAECGASTIDGSRMLLHQAARQFEIYTGERAPLNAMDQALHRDIAH